MSYLIIPLAKSIHCVKRQLSKCKGLTTFNAHLRCPKHEAHRSITTPPGGCLCSTALSRVICQVISTRFLAEEQPESEALIITVPPIRYISWNKLKNACLQTSSSSVVIHFRVQLCLSFKTSLSAKHFFCKWLWFTWKWTCRRNPFSYEYFSLKLVSKQRDKRTRKWPIENKMYSKEITLILF